MASIYLVGFMGSGKTAVGAALSDRLERPFVDLDESVEKHLGMTIREIFRQHGEDAFRHAETAELERVTGHSDRVVATGGGLFSNPANRELIHRSGGVSIFLDLPWDAIVRRLGAADPSRPKWIDCNHAGDLFLARRPDYLRASVRLPLDGGEPPLRVAESIVAALSEAMCAI